MASEMTRLLVALALSYALCVPAFAGAAQPLKSDSFATRAHKYWLSHDLQRLVFWQAPDARVARR